VAFVFVLVQLPLDAVWIVIFVADYICQPLMFNEVVGCPHLGMMEVTPFPQITVQRV
jgi:hypothetical protein